MFTIGVTIHNPNAANPTPNSSDIPVTDAIAGRRGLAEQLCLTIHTAAMQRRSELISIGKLPVTRQSLPPPGQQRGGL